MARMRFSRALAGFGAVLAAACVPSTGQSGLLDGNPVNPHALARIEFFRSPDMGGSPVRGVVWRAVVLPPGYSGIEARLVGRDLWVTATPIGGTQEKIHKLLPAFQESQMRSGIQTKYFLAGVTTDTIDVLEDGTEDCYERKGGYWKHVPEPTSTLGPFFRQTVEDALSLALPGAVPVRPSPSVAPQVTP